MEWRSDTIHIQAKKKIKDAFEAIYKLTSSSNELVKKIARKTSIQNVKEIPERVRVLFVVAHDISAEWHVRMQAAFQKNTDNAVSKTINFPNNATPDDIDRAYRIAYKLGCKGVTVYRHGSRDRQVLRPVESEGTLAELTSECQICP